MPCYIYWKRHFQNFCNFELLWYFYFESEGTRVFCLSTPLITKRCNDPGKAFLIIKPFFSLQISGRRSWISTNDYRWWYKGAQKTNGSCGFQVKLSVLYRALVRSPEHFHAENRTSLRFKSFVCTCASCLQRALAQWIWAYTCMTLTEGFGL